MDYPEIKLDDIGGYFQFNNHLPIYNWLHPLDGYSQTHNSFEPFLESIDTSHIRRRSLYFHTPFCETICSFCPFTRGLFRNQDIVEKYVEAILKEIELKAEYTSITAVPIESIFFGGGTPSVLSAQNMKEIGNRIRNTFDLSELKEWSFEVEVKSVTEEKILALKDIGVTKIRFGLQTFSPRYRTLFNLTATIEDIHRAVALFKKYNFSVSFDILYGMDGQSIEEFAYDILEASKLGTDAIDFYPINNLVTQSKLKNSFKKEDLAPSTALQKMSWSIFLNNYLKSLGFQAHNGHGFVRVEKVGTSNPVVSQENYTFYYHETVYGYHDRDLIGFGSAAVSRTFTSGSENESDRGKYIKNLLDSNSLPQTKVVYEPQFAKPIIFRLPYFGSIDKSKIAWNHISAETIEKIDRLIESDLVSDSGDYFRLTEKGYFSYVNLMYYLLPSEEKKHIDRFVQSSFNSSDHRDGSWSLNPAHYV